MSDNNFNHFYLYSILYSLMNKNINLSSRGIILYVLMCSRKNLSKKNEHRFTDENGVFIYFTNQEICKILNCSQPTASATVNELINAGILERKRESGKTAKYYVKLITSDSDGVAKDRCDVSFDTKKAELKSRENRKKFGTVKNSKRARKSNGELKSN